MFAAFRFPSDTDAVDTIGVKSTVEGMDVEVDEDSADVCSAKRAEKST